MLRTIVFTAATLFAEAAAMPGAIVEPVHLDAGLISGVAGSNPDVRVFKGVPYAAAPVGKLRWRAPQPAEHWSGVRVADQFGTVCEQLAFRGAGPDAKPPKASEDCLFLNVWTAAKSASDKRPVMVWIHPGGYTTGSGSAPGFDGEALAKK